MVPPKPNELTAAIRVPSGQRLSALAIERDSLARSLGDSPVGRGWGKISLSRTASDAASSPAAPAAASRWPRFALMLPTARLPRA